MIRTKIHTKAKLNLAFIATNLMRPMAFVFAVGLSSFAHSADMDPFEKTITVRSVGDVRLVYKSPGEPMIAPSHFEIWVKCSGSDEEVRVQHVGMCELRNYEYDQKVRLLTLNYVTAEVDSGGHTQCNLEEEKEFKLAHICRDLKRQKKTKSPK